MSIKSSMNDGPSEKKLLMPILQCLNLSAMFLPVKDEPSFSLVHTKSEKAAKPFHGNLRCAELAGSAMILPSRVR